MFFLGNPKCFSGDDHVSMASGETKLLRDVRPGDRVLAMNSEKVIVEDVVMMMLDSQPNRPGKIEMSHDDSMSFLFVIISVVLFH